MGVVSAADTGAPHKRERIWIVANASGERCDNWRNYRQGRQVLHDKDGNAAQGQPKWQGRLSGIGEAGSAKEFPDSGGKGLQGARKPETMAQTGRNPNTNSLPDAVEFQHGETYCLNPQWVEWLMGWPIGWTELKPLAMDRFREWQQQHSIFCEVGCDEF